MKYGPDPNLLYPNENIKSVCFIKNVITRPNIMVGDYTYYDDINGAEKFEEHVTHHYKKRFEDELIEYLLITKWWDWPAEKVFENLEILCSGNVNKIRGIN